ncbi:hypothetical protein F5887DRAFT_1238560 [Amanita rubescens]|nr:hypothetical protein F5887DRAFT_1238560 [Amanita rubescens]
MNVLSKLSTKVPLPSNRVAESYLEVGYNKCDNPDCKYWNSVQPVIGHYNCKGFIPKPDATGTENGSNQHRAAAGGEPDCIQVYPPKQAYFASHLFCAAGSEHCKRARAKLKQDKASRKAAREARSKAAKLAKEVEKEFKRDLMEREVRKKKEWLEDLRKGKDRWLTKAQGKGEEKQDVQQPAEPVKRLKRETRRLPVTIRKAVSGDTADSESSTIASHVDTDDSLPQTPPQSAPPTPNLRRRDTPPRPRPKGVVWDESSITPPRVAQYPLISRSPNRLDSKPASPNTSLNTSTSSLPDISGISPLFEKYRNKNGNESNGLAGARSSPGLSAAHTTRSLPYSSASEG